MTRDKNRQPGDRLRREVDHPEFAFALEIIFPLDKQASVVLLLAKLILNRCFHNQRENVNIAAYGIRPNSNPQVCDPFPQLIRGLQSQNQ